MKTERSLQDAFKEIERKRGQDEFVKPGSAVMPKAIDQSRIPGVGSAILALVQNHTEADPAAILFNVLCAFGNVVGRRPFVNLDRAHHLNLFVTVVGVSALSRKGTAWSIAKRFFEGACGDDFRKFLQPGGLASGEGLISRLADKGDSPEESNLKKRLLVVEEEFRKVFDVGKREGSTLNGIIRNAWDGVDLSILTKKKPIKATGHHISIVGMITRSELNRCIAEVDIYNGFANRFLWCFSDRARVLPRPPVLSSIGGYDSVLDALKSTIEFGRRTDELVFGNGAEVLWDEYYFELSKERPGVAAEVTNRATAQLARIAAIIALMDESSKIERPHLIGAKEIIRYATESAEYIFGNKIGDKLADKIYAELDVRPTGLNLTGIHGTLNRNSSAADVHAAIELLKSSGLVILFEDTYFSSRLVGQGKYP